MEWEIKEKLNLYELSLKIGKLKEELYGRTFIHSNGDVYRVEGISMVCKKNNYRYAVNYHHMSNKKVTFTMELKDFMDGRFADI